MSNRSSVKFWMVIKLDRVVKCQDGTIPYHDNYHLTPAGHEIITATNPPSKIYENKLDAMCEVERLTQKEHCPFGLLELVKICKLLPPVPMPVVWEDILFEQNQKRCCNE